MNKFEIDHLDLYYQDFHALKEIALDIPEHEITAFIGPSGCGKSTFLKCLNRMNDLVEGCRITGSVRLDQEVIWKYGHQCSEEKSGYGISETEPIPDECI